jgi:hypothetical protein
VDGGLDGADDEVRREVEVAHHDLAAAAREQRAHACDRPLREGGGGVGGTELRHLGREHPVERRLDQMGRDVGLDDRADDGRERRVTEPRHHDVEPALELRDVARLQLREQGLLVREVLVERPHAHPGRGSDPVGREGAVAVADQNASRRGEDRVDGGVRARLRGPFAGLRGVCGMHGARCRNASCEIRAIARIL